MDHRFPCGALVRTIVVFAVAIIVAGCVSQQSAPPLIGETQTPETIAAAALQRGDFVTAAARYAALSEQASGGLQTTYRLRSALLYFDLGEPEAARAAVAAAQPATAEERALQQLARGVEQLQAEGPATPLSVLNAIDASHFDAYEKGVYLRALGRAQARIHDPAAVINFLNAELLPLSLQRRSELTHLIWENLIRASDEEAIDRADQRNPNLEGWRALLRLVRDSQLDPAAFAAAIGDWRVRYVRHPANDLLVDELIEQAEEAGTGVSRVALLLPFEGELAEYANAIRDGFVATRFASGDTTMTVRTYSAAGSAVPAAYDHAVADGAQLIVGPLDKAGVEALLAHAARPKPVLALNAVAEHTEKPSGDPSAATPLLQFGLVPEDEAAEVARRMWQDGHRRVAILVPNTDAGSRMEKAFAADWQALGGSVVEDTRYASSVESYQDAVRKTFSLAQSEARAAALREALRRPVVVVARPRPDLDAVMLMASPVEGRQILPQFRYLGVDNVPVYAAPGIFDGHVNPRVDKDLDGVTFATMPWLLERDAGGLRQIIEHRWRTAAFDYAPFYAFGADAYRLTRLWSQIQRAPSATIAGMTGRLSTGPDGRIRRRLAWARFQDGTPQALPD